MEREVKIFRESIAAIKQILGEIAMSERTLILKDQTAVKRVAERLSQCPEVTKYDQGEEKEAGVLAHSFGDLEESCSVFLNEHLPKLLDEQATVAELCEVLFEIGEEFRHILYHIHDPSSISTFTAMVVKMVVFDRPTLRNKLPAGSA